ncbi:hypothetical protein Hanom_Chr17g01569101 [Helianthus anomalus]
MIHLLSISSMNFPLLISCPHKSDSYSRYCMVYILSFVEIKTEADNLLLARGN